jgi:hypothetical protein
MMFSRVVFLIEKAVNKGLVSPAVKESLTVSHIASLEQVWDLFLHQISVEYGLYILGIKGLLSSLPSRSLRI